MAQIAWASSTSRMHCWQPTHKIHHTCLRQPFRFFSILSMVCFLLLRTSSRMLGPIHSTDNICMERDHEKM
uniref:Uncharacterized protein n=1 Tax=Anguilla anguilla TaxID=7936 RepID=A0A0E9XK10_ANGAN